MLIPIPPHVKQVICYTGDGDITFRSINDIEEHVGIIPIDKKYVGYTQTASKVKRIELPKQYRDVRRYLNDELQVVDDHNVPYKEVILTMELIGEEYATD